jgi:hypothetical protein
MPILPAAAFLAAARGDLRGELERGAARRVDLARVVGLDDLRVVAGPEALGGELHELLQHDHADREVRGHDQRDLAGEPVQLRALRFRNRRGADGARDAALRGGAHERHGRPRRRERDRDVGGVEPRREIGRDADAVLERLAELRVAGRLDRGAEHGLRLLRDGGAHALAHPAERAEHEDPRQRSPSSFIAAWRRSRFAGESRTSGSRSSSCRRPRSARAHLTGIGFVSQKSASRSGSSR